MGNFEKSLLRLKEQLGVPTDKEAAELLGLTDKALNARKRRDSFPIKEVFALAAQRPELGLDPDWIVTGTSHKMETTGSDEASLVECYRKMNTNNQQQLRQIALLWSGEMVLGMVRRTQAAISSENPLSFTEVDVDKKEVFRAADGVPFSLDDFND